MPLLEQSNKQDIARLLELFSASRLKDAFSEFSGTKEEISAAAAKAADVERVRKFVTDNLAKCKLHTYIFSKPQNDVDFLVAIPGAEVMALPDADTTITLTRIRYRVLLRGPYEEQDIEFLWPMRILRRSNCIILSVVVFERSACKYFVRECSIISRNIDEKKIVADFVSLGAPAHDLHKGVKALWKAGFMDAFKTKYKKPLSMASEEMDEEKGIKANNPDLFQELENCTLFSTMFRIPASEDCSVEVFHVDPSAGSISFPQYTRGGGDSDEVVTAILDANS